MKGLTSAAEIIRKTGHLAMPSGIQLVTRYHQRFKRLGLTNTQAAASTVSHHSRLLLNSSMLDDVPVAVLQDANIVIDVGANEGLWSEAVWRFVRPNRILAFEPSPKTFARLEERFRSLPGAKALNLALGDRVGDTTLHLFDHPEFDSLHAPAPALATTYELTEMSSQTVPLSTLDEVLASETTKGEIALLKLDVQGSELSVLAGAKATLERTRCLIVEMLFTPHYLDEALFADLHRFITDGGKYEFHNFATLASDGNGALQWADAIYINRRLSSL